LNLISGFDFDPSRLKSLIPCQGETELIICGIETVDHELSVGIGLSLVSILRVARVYGADGDTRESLSTRFPDLTLDSPCPLTQG
jgi:hypothetical protein